MSLFMLNRVQPQPATPRLLLPSTCLSRRGGGSPATQILWALGLYPPFFDGRSPLNGMKYGLESVRFLDYEALIQLVNLRYGPTPRFVDRIPSGTIGDPHSMRFSASRRAATSRSTLGEVHCWMGFDHQELETYGRW